MADPYGLDCPAAAPLCLYCGIRGCSRQHNSRPRPIIRRRKR